MSEPGPSDADRRDDIGVVERWGFEAVFEGGALAVAVAVGRDRRVGRGWYRAVVTGTGRRPVVVVDPDVPLPVRSGSLEFRAPGLWCDHAPDQPLPAWPSGSAPAAAAPVELPHWTVAAEAFGIAVDDPWEVWGRGFGDRTAVGLDLGFEVVTAVGGGAGASGGWDLAGCEVVGEVLVAEERHEVTGVGVLTYDCGPVPVPPRGSWRRWWVQDRGVWVTDSGVLTGLSSVAGGAPGEAEPAGVGVIDGPLGRTAVGPTTRASELGGWVTWRPGADGGSG